MSTEAKSFGIGIREVERSKQIAENEKRRKIMDKMKPMYIKEYFIQYIIDNLKSIRNTIIMKSVR